MLRLLRRPLFWLIVLGVISAGGVGGMMFTQAQAKKAQAAAEAKAKPVETPYAAIANGKADVEGGLISVAARTSGIIEDVYVQEGQQVRKGQVLAKLEDAQLRLAAMSAEAELAQARAQIGTLSVVRDTALRERARFERLATSNHIAQAKLDQAGDSVRTADAGINTQQAAIAMYETLGFRRWGTHPYYACVGGKAVAGHYYFKDLTETDQQDETPR